MNILFYLFFGLAFIGILLALYAFLKECVSIKNVVEMQDETKAYYMIKDAEKEKKDEPIDS